MVDLHTTNVLLGLMAGVSVLEALLLIGMGVGGYLVYSRVMTLISDLEARQIAPLRGKVDAILADVKSVTARVSEQTSGSITRSRGRWGASTKQRNASGDRC